MQLNITDLPFDVRFGLWLPKQCTQDTMTRAGAFISKNLSGLASMLAKFLKIELLIKYNVGVQVTFTQPDAWYSKQANEKVVSASIVTWIFVFFAWWIGASAIYHQLKERVLRVNSLKNHSKNDEHFRRFLGEENERARESTKPSSLKFISSMTSPVTSNELPDQVRGNQEKDVVLNYDNFEQESDSSSIQEKFGYGLLNDIALCFSPRYNIYRLVQPRPFKTKYKDLECLEGIRVLTMWWLILANTAMYISTLPCRNIYIMYAIFQTLAFTLAAAGNQSPNILIFLLYFISFIKIYEFSDTNNGISGKSYLKIYFNRLLKYAPIYYFCLIFGWFVLPLLTQKASWYVSERLFWNCEGQLPFVLTFTNSLFVSFSFDKQSIFVKNSEGCYYWNYLISNDVILYTMFPLFVIVYRRNKLIFHIINFLVLSIGVMTFALIVHFNDITAGAISLESFYTFSYLFTKPYTKLISVAIANYLAVFYLNLLEYKRTETDHYKSKYFLIHAMHKSWIVVIFMYAYAIGIFNLVTAVLLTANQDAYSWAKWQNVVYFAFGRLGLVSAVAVVIMILVTGNAKWVNSLLSWSLWRPFARLSLWAYILYPFAVSVQYMTDTSIFISYMSVIYMVVSTLVITYAISFVAFMLIESPMHNLWYLLYSYLDPLLKTKNQRSSSLSNEYLEKVLKINTSTGNL